MQLSSHFILLAETEKYILGHEFEYIYIIHKKTKKKIYVGGAYGEPDFGLIDIHEKWAIAFGSETYIWTPKEIKELTDEAFQCVYDARQTGVAEVEFLTDPWCATPAVYRYDLLKGTLLKLRPFPKVASVYEAGMEKIPW